MTRSNHRFGLFLKLMGAFLLIVLTVAVLVNWIARRSTRNEFNLYITSAGQQQAAVLAQFLAGYYEANGGWEGVEAVLPGPHHGGPGMDGGPRAPRGFFSRAESFGRGPTILLADTNGRIIASTSDELRGVQLDEAELANGVPILVNEQRVGTLLVTIGGLANSDSEAFLRQVNRAILLAVILASVVALFVGGVIAWGITRPLRQLTTAAEAIAGGDYSQQVDVPPGDEIGDLAAAFNKMAAELAHSEQLRQQMTADIAHELRTPITVIQGNVEALQDGIFPLTPDALDPIRDKTALLARLVEDLRQLTLAETGQLRLNRVPTDLEKLAGRTVEAFRPAAEAKIVTLALETADSLPPANADPQRIEQVLVNLLANALQHTPAGGAITIKLASAGDSLRISVQDNGPGIAAEDLPNVFERFYRADKSRAREGESDGTGLGLAVARTIVEAHQGQIGVASGPGQGATFWFTLPVVGVSRQIQA